jgi:PAS domain S-box-containing protein
VNHLENTALVAKIELIKQEFQEELLARKADRPLLPKLHSLSGEPDIGSQALRNFIALNAVAVVRSNIQGEIWEANQAFCDLIGCTQEEVQAKKIRWVDITPPDSSAQAVKAVKDLLAVGKAGPFEKEYIHKDGHHIPVMIVILALDSAGNDWLAFILDLTEQKQAERSLKSSEAQFRDLAESIPQLVWITDAQSNITYANKRLYDYTGLDPSNAKYADWQRIIHPDDVTKFVDNWKRSATFSNAYEMEVRYLRSDGIYHWFLSRTVPVTNEKNEVLMWIGTSTDIDEQKHQEDELRESELQYRTLADAIPQIVWTATANGEINFFNSRFFEYTGLTWEQGRKQGWSLLIHPEDRDRYMDGWQRALRTGDTYEQEFRLRRAAGIKQRGENQYRWHLSRAVALRGEDGSIQKWFATWTEIEDQKKN